MEVYKVFRLGDLTCASFQTDEFGLQLSADGGSLQPVEGAGCQTNKQQRRRASWKAVVLNHNAVEEKGQFNISEIYPVKRLKVLIQPTFLYILPGYGRDD